MKKTTRILLVGHCGFDSGPLTHVAQLACEGAAVECVNHEADLADVGPECLLLVNRVLDGRFSSNTGIDLIARLVGYAEPPMALLVSNYADAQIAAENAGAAPGFGKHELHTSKPIDCIRAALSQAPHNA